MRANEFEPDEQASLPGAEVRQMRPAPTRVPTTVTRTFYLDAPNGEVIEVKVKGIPGTYRLKAEHDSLVLTTGDKDAKSLSAEMQTPRRAAQPPPRMSGNPSEPGGTIEEFLPGDDDVTAEEEEMNLALKADSLAFLRSAEKDLMRRGSAG